MFITTLLLAMGLGTVTTLTPPLESETHISGMAMSPDKESIVYMLQDDRKPLHGNSLRVLPVNGEEPRVIHPLFGGGTNYLKSLRERDFSFDSKMVLYSGNDGGLFLGDLRGSGNFHKLGIPGVVLNYGAFIPGSYNAIIFAGAYKRETLYFFDFDTGSYTPIFHRKGLLGNFKISPDGDFAVIFQAHYKEKVNDLVLMDLRNFSTRLIKLPATTHDEGEGSFGSLSFSPDSKRLLAFYNYRNRRNRSERSWLYMHNLDSDKTRLIDEGTKQSWLSEAHSMEEGKWGLFLSRDKVVYQRDVNGDQVKDFVFADYDGNRLEVVHGPKRRGWDDYSSIMPGKWGQDKETIFFKQRTTGELLRLDVVNYELSVFPLKQKGADSWDVTIHPGCSGHELFYSEYEGAHDSRTGVSTGAYKMLRADFATGKSKVVYSGDMWLRDIAVGEGCGAIFGVEGPAEFSGTRVLKIEL